MWVLAARFGSCVFTRSFGSQSFGAHSSGNVLSPNFGHYYLFLAFSFSACECIKCYHIHKYIQLYMFALYISWVCVCSGSNSYRPFFRTPDINLVWDTGFYFPFFFLAWRVSVCYYWWCFWCSCCCRCRCSSITFTIFGRLFQYFFPLLLLPRIVWCVRVCVFLLGIIHNWLRSIIWL